MSEFVAVIMAGGKGQRFWPLSTEARPKQFLDLERCGRTMLQATFDRLLPAAGGRENVLVVTGERYAPLVREQLPELPDGNLLLEPVGRDTAPAIALAALELEARYGDPIMGLFPSDHRIGNAPAFQDTLRRALRLARDTRGLVTLGIRPNHAATGYGYIERGAPEGDGFRVARFIEKPDRVRAERFLAAGNYSWNGGIFLWSVTTILEELQAYAPGVLTPLSEAYAAGSVTEAFGQLDKISIDYAVLEKTRRAFVLPCDFDWDDVGDWVALERLLGQGQGANTVVGRHVGREAHGNIVYTENAEDVIVTLGVENLVIVKRGNTVLLVRKDRVQDIKKLLEDERLGELV
ncbi:MAG TPA: mannose-1-phosphate guanylyltransferase [Trueperaceae bacterium]